MPRCINDAFHQGVELGSELGRELGSEPIPKLGAPGALAGVDFISGGCNAGGRGSSISFRPIWLHRTTDDRDMVYSTRNTPAALPVVQGNPVRF
eukprot:4873828-Pyramimonas_sp.AAC.3